MLPHRRLELVGVTHDAAKILLGSAPAPKSRLRSASEQLGNRRRAKLAGPGDYEDLWPHQPSPAHDVGRLERRRPDGRGHKARSSQCECPGALTRENQTMLWTILVILVILWLLGFKFAVGGGLIHILLVVAVIVLIINLVSGRRRG